MRIYHKGFNYSQDGPGNRLVYHLQGCNFRCKWCSNPESMDPDSSDARDASPADILDEAMRSRKLFFDGGGVTFTGGECALQFDELLKTLKLLRASGISTCIETNASHPRLGELLPYIDVLIADLKLIEPDRHRFYTGSDNRQVLRNIRNIAQSGRQALIRIPLVNHVNTDPAPFAAFFRSIPLDHIEVEILRYHEFGREKWGEDYEIDDGFVTDEQYEFFVKTLTDAGCRVVYT